MVAALAAAVLLATGCSSGSSSSSSSAATSSATSAAATAGASSVSATAAAQATQSAPADEVGITATTIRVGLIADVDTTLAPGLFQDSVNAIDEWAKEVNANGGLAGRQVVVDFCDSKLDPNASTACVIKECQNDFALVGTSANALSDMSDIDSCKDAAGKGIGIPNLAAFTFPPMACDPDTYTGVGLGTYCSTATQKPQTYTVPIGDARYFAAKYSGLNGIWLYDTDVPTFKITQTPEFQAESNVGIKQDGEGFYGVSGEDPESALTPYVQQIKASNASYVYDDVTPQSMVLLMKEAKLQGVNSVKVWECNSGCYDPSFYQLGGATVNGTYASLNDLPWMTDYTANPTLDKLITGLGGVSKFNNNALEGYVMALLFQDAVSKVVASGQTLDRASLFNVLNHDETAFNADGIMGTTDISAHGVSDCQVLVQLVNGAWQRVDPTTPNTFDCSTANLSTLKMNTSS